MILIPNIVVTLVIGFISCFMGYRFFRVVLALLAFAFGFVLGQSLLTTDNTTLQLAAGAGLGFICALGSYLAFSIASFLIGGLFGALVALAAVALLTQSGQSETLLLIGAAVVGFVVGATLAGWLTESIIVIGTAYVGAAALTYGLGQIVPELAFLTDQHSLAGMIAWLVVGTIGLLVQLNLRRND